MKGKGNNRVENVVRSLFKQFGHDQNPKPMTAEREEGKHAVEINLINAISAWRNNREQENFVHENNEKDHINKIAQKSKQNTHNTIKMYVFLK